MGYRAFGQGSIIINAENYDAAYNALIALDEEYKREPQIPPFEDLDDERFNILFDFFALEQLNGAIKIISSSAKCRFSLSGSPLDHTEEKDIISALAPYIKENSEFVWLGEEDDAWRWTFKNGELIETTGRRVVVWDE